MIETDQSTPVTPMPLLPTAPMMPATMRAVAVVVHRVAVVGDEIVAVNVADEAVVAGVGVRPDVGRQVGMVVVDARVDHGHDDLRAAGGDVPGCLGVDRAEGPEVAVQGIVGHRLGLPHRVLLEAFEVRVALQAILRGGQRCAAAANQNLPGEPKTLEDLKIDAAALGLRGKLPWTHMRLWVWATEPKPTIEAAVNWTIQL